MKNKVLKMAKRLGKFCIDDISQIITADEVELKKLLQDLIDEESIIQRTDRTYFYQEKSKNKTSKLPLFFEFHTRQEIELIIKCFCSNIEVAKAVNIIGIKKSCLSNFYKYFRELIYTRQLEVLQSYFIQNPKTPQEREYLGKKYYLYLYGCQLFVSEIILKHKKMWGHVDTERLEIKNIFLRASRKVLNYSYKHFYHLHLAEEIWRLDKSFTELQNTLLKSL